MLQGEHSAILLTFIKLQFVIKIFVLFIFEWPFRTGFTVLNVFFSYQNDCACEMGLDARKSYFFLHANNKDADQPAQPNILDQCICFSLSTKYTLAIF